MRGDLADTPVVGRPTEQLGVGERGHQVEEPCPLSVRRRGDQADGLGEPGRSVGGFVGHQNGHRAQ